MSRNSVEYAGLELVDEVDEGQADGFLLDDGDLDDQILDYDEGNQVALHDESTVETDSVTPGSGNRSSQRREAEAELRPPLMLASRIVVPPTSRPAPPPVLASVVVCEKYKQINDSTNTSFEPNSVCHRDVPGHEKCGHIQLRDLEKDASRDMRYLYVRTPLQHAMVLHAKRGGYGARKNAFIRQLLGDAPNEAINVYERFRTERATVKDTLRSTDMWQAYTERFKSCRPANKFLKADPTKAIWFRTKLGDQIEDKEEQNRFRSLLATSYEALQKIRLKYCHPGKTLLNCNAIIIGDDLATDLHKHMKIGGFHVNVPSAALAAEALNKYVFGSACKLVLVLVGQTDLRDGRTPSEIVKSCHGIAEQLKQFAHLKVAWLPLPYLHEQQRGWAAFVELMRPMANRYPDHTYYYKFEGRDITEIFREGNSHCPETVNLYGTPTGLGWRVYIRFLRSVGNLQIPGPLVRSEQSEPGANPEDRRPEKSGAGPSGSKESLQSAADLLKVAEDALRAARGFRVATEVAMCSSAAKRARASSPDDDVIYVGSEHIRFVNP